MKFRFGSFLSGVLCATLVFSLAISALAISGNVSFNLSAIKFDGVVISEAGDGYTLSNGCVAPASITYTDEQGGGTTYLPVRRIGELAGVTIDWDGAVVVKSKEFVEQEKREADTPAKPDYSNWSAEDEAAYQEFKGLLNGHREDAAWQLYRLDNESLSYYRNVEKEFAYRCLKRMIKEAASDEERLIIFKIKNEEYSDAVDQMLLRICSEGDKVKLNVDVIWDNLPFELGHQWADIEI